MKITKFNKNALLLILNREAEGCVYFNDGEYWISTDLEMPEELYEKSDREGMMIKIATEVRAITPSDLKKVDDYFDYDCFKDYLIEAFGPHSEGDWAFDDIFQDAHLDDLREASYQAIMKEIKEKPHRYLAQDTDGFFSIEKYEWVTYENRKWRFATSTDHAKRMRKNALAKLSKDEKDLLGL